ncbi:FAD-dependent oxidoreductase [uncultured Tateyamaria sp.]|uniref:NAD(P)/FAD-dependent oxidoreductase n=1 Tax=Tateyamaria sp. 1078 TaxID=3417464 RepID=UPI00262C200D|nr:FAD-dependent oxidoreductase [uncultured Tateyamaria sp.]
MTPGIVIAGAGYCGVCAARAAREAGYDGQITVIGDDPEWPYERPPLSKWDGVAPRLQPIFAEDWYAGNNVDLRRGIRVTGIDRAARTVALGTGEVLQYAHLLLATGASPRRLHANAVPGARPSYLRSYSDAQMLAQGISAGADVLIIGGGFIGLELAATLAARKAFVHVVEAQDRILARAVPSDISKMVLDLHLDRGVTVHTGTAVDAINNGVAFLSSGQSVRAEHVIVGIGSVPNTDLAVDAGLRADNGISVNERFVTQDPDIFAAGDCCNVPIAGAGRARFESWQVAGDQGRFAGQVMAGARPDPLSPPWFWSDQFGHSLQVVGQPSMGTQTVLRRLPQGGMIAIETRADGQIAYAAGFAPGNAVGRDIKIIQRLMDGGVVADPTLLSDPDTPLKAILKRR